MRDWARIKAAMSMSVLAKLFGGCEHDWRHYQSIAMVAQSIYVDGGGIVKGEHTVRVVHQRFCTRCNKLEDYAPEVIPDWAKDGIGKVRAGFARR